MARALRHELMENERISQRQTRKQLDPIAHDHTALESRAQLQSERSAHSQKEEIGAMRREKPTVGGLKDIERDLRTVNHRISSQHLQTKTSSKRRTQKSKGSSQQQKIARKPLQSQPNGNRKIEPTNVIRMKSAIKLTSHVRIHCDSVVRSPRSDRVRALQPAELRRRSFCHRTSEPTKRAK